jgi:hypothetical protein
MGIASAQKKVPPDNIVKANITLNAQAERRLAPRARKEMHVIRYMRGPEQTPPPNQPERKTAFLSRRNRRGFPPSRFVKVLFELCPSKTTRKVTNSGPLAACEAEKSGKGRTCVVTKEV